MDSSTHEGEISLPKGERLIDLDNLHLYGDNLDNKSFDTHTSRPTDIELRRDNPSEVLLGENDDENLSKQAMEAIEKDDYQLALDCVADIDDKNILNGVVHDIVTYLVSVGEPRKARKFARLIRDINVWRDEMDYIRKHELGEGDLPAVGKNSGDEASPTHDFDSNIIPFPVSPNEIRKRREDDSLSPTHDFEPNTPVTPTLPEDGSDTESTDFVKFAEDKLPVIETEEEGTPKTDATYEDFDILNRTGFVESPEEKTLDLDASREDYFNQYLVWQNKRKEKKSAFQRILSNLGVDRQLPEEKEPNELVEARERYNLARENHNRELIDSIKTVPNQDQKPLGLMEAVMQDRREQLVAFEENESDMFFDKLKQAETPEVRNRLERTSSIWNNMSTSHKRVFGAALIFGSSFGAGVIYGSGFNGFRAQKMGIEDSLNPGIKEGETKPESIETKIEIKKEIIPDKKDEEVLPTSVDLSPKGFIEDIHNLKAKILAEYHDKEIPDSVQKNILNKTPIELAKNFGFYDPSHNTSGVGLKGESLGVDNEGNIYYEHLDGNKEIIFDSKTGEVKGFGGKMVKNEADVEKTAEVVKEDVVKLENEEGAEDKSPEKTTEEEFSFNGIKISHPESIKGKEIVVLDDKYQEGPQYVDLRDHFVKAFERSVTIDTLGPSPIAEPFEGGKIYVVYGVKDNPNEIRILLNGKEIANGSFNNGNPKITMDPKLKNKWYLADSVYERAFKHINGMIKRKIFDFKV